MDPSHLDDETLLRQIAQQQPEALATLYDRYSRLVFSLALNALGNPNTAEEITQDVFMRVWDRASTYRADQGKVSTWLSRIARNRAIDVLRQQRVRPEHHSVEWAEVPLAALPRIGGPEEEVALAMEQRRVREAVVQLPEEQREVLALAYFQGLSHSQIAEQVGQPLGTVKTRIRLGMGKLRQMLSDE